MNREATSTVIARRFDAEKLGPTAAAIGFLVIALNYGPMVWLGVMSISSEPMSGIPGPFTLEWYRALFADRRWIDPLMASLIMGGLVGATCGLSSIIVARTLPQLGAASRGRVLSLFLIPLLVPGVLLGAGLFIYLRVTLGLKLGWWSIFVAHFVWAYPFSLLALLIVTSRFDRRLTEVASDLGATPWRAFVDIELPFILPGVVSAVMFGFLFSFSELARSVLLRGGKTTLPIYEWIEASAHSSSVPLIFALSTMELLCSTVVVVMAFSILFGRQP